MIIYPSTTLHEVAPVTSGERSLFTFMESAIPNQMNRELLYTLNEVSALEGFNIAWENRRGSSSHRQSATACGQD